MQESQLQHNSSTDTEHSPLIVLGAHRVDLCVLWNSTYIPSKFLCNVCHHRRDNRSINNGEKAFVPIIFSVSQTLSFTYCNAADLHVLVHNKQAYMQATITRNDNHQLCMPYNFCKDITCTDSIALCHITPNLVKLTCR